MTIPGTKSSPLWDRVPSSLGSDTLTTVTPAPVVNRSDYFTFLSAGLPALNYTTALFDEPDRDSNEEWPESEDEDDKGRSEERRVGKEGSARCGQCHVREKA